MGRVVARLLPVGLYTRDLNVPAAIVHDHQYATNWTPDLTAIEYVILLAGVSILTLIVLEIFGIHVLA